MTQVVFAEEEVTVHERYGDKPDKDQTGREVWSVASRTLLPGQSVSTDKLPPYQLEAVKAGKVAGLKLVSESEAKKLGAEADARRSADSPGALAVEVRETQHSDYLVPDSERAANHAELALEEAGDGVASDDPANPLVGHAKAGARVTETTDVTSGKPAATATEDTGENDSAKQQKVVQDVKDDKGK